MACRPLHARLSRGRAAPPQPATRAPPRPAHPTRAPLLPPAQPSTLPPPSTACIQVPQGALRRRSSALAPCCAERPMRASRPASCCAGASGRHALLVDVGKWFSETSQYRVRFAGRTKSLLLVLLAHHRHHLDLNLPPSPVRAFAARALFEGVCLLRRATGVVGRMAHGPRLTK